MLKAAFRRVLDYRDDNELAVTLWATLYGFLILFSYYVLRAVRDEISSADRGNLQYLWTAVFFVMLLAVPAYSWLNSRVSRDRFIPAANRFFIACLLGFWLALAFLPETFRPWIDRIFYVWASVFALFVVTVFWGLVADCFTNEQSRRLFAFIAVGSSLGGIAGSGATAVLADSLPVFSLLLIACLPLELASWCALALHRRSGTGDITTPESRTQPVAGSAWDGFKLVAQSRYMTGIAAFIALMTLASTFLYFQQADVLKDAFADRGERRAFYANIDLITNILTIVFQVYLTAIIVRWLGVAFILAVIPALTALGFLALGLEPTLWTLVIVQVAYRAGRYGLTKPGREMLWTVLAREDKYKAKPFLDAAVYRGGDLVTGWIYTGLAALGLSVAAIALTAVPVAAIWAALGWHLGKEQERRAVDTGTSPSEVEPELGETPR